MHMKSLTRPELPWLLSKPRGLKKGGVLLPWRNNEMMHRNWPLLRLGLLLALMVSAAGCSSAPTRWLAPQQVAIPLLPTEARQGPTPSICSPTCSDGLAFELKNLRELRIAPGSLD